MHVPDEVPTVAGQGVLLAPWADDDVPAVLELAKDDETRAWSGSLRRVHDGTDARAWIAGRYAPGRLDWAVRDPVTGMLLGRVGLHAFGQEPPSAEVGYGTHPAHRRRGIAQAALTAASEFAFDSLGMIRLSLVHAVGNHASCKVATRCGFAYEGTERAALDHGDGVLHDSHRHARLASDPVDAVATNAVRPVGLGTDRLQLRPVSISDTDAIVPILLDPDVLLWNPGPRDTSPAGLRHWCARAAAWSDGGHATFSVLDAGSADLLAVVSLHRIDEVSKDAEIGYRTAPGVRGKGVATEAVAAVTTWAFRELGLLRIEARHAVANAPSCRVAEKCGYRLEGTLRQGYEYGDGVRHDEHLHARLSTD